MTDFPAPHERTGQVGREAVERKLRALLDDGSLSHGWIISGARGAGKATLAYRIARAALSPGDLTDSETLQIGADTRTARLVAARAHPDIFVAERDWDDKKSRFKTEISVDTIRRLISFLNHTSASGGARVGIIDTADDLNRNAANALLKVLEEPPRRALLLVLSASPGRLLATIRSRCRRINLPPLGDDAVAALLRQETSLDADARKDVVAVAKGRPGYALQLAHADGVAAATLADRFVAALLQGPGAAHVAEVQTAVADDDVWANFRDALATMLHRRAVDAAVSGDAANAALAVEAQHAGHALFDRGAALNMNRAQLLDAFASDLAALRRQYLAN